MWLQRLGTVDERIFIAFGVVSGVVLLLAVVNLVFTCCRKRRFPGHSVSQILICSSVLICAAVLFRGVQPKWGTFQQLRPLCPIFLALMLLGYTAYAASTMVISWALLLKYKFNKLHAHDEWKLSMVVWMLLMAAGIAAVVWIVVFNPEVSISQNITLTNNYDQSVYVCGEDDENHHQFIWRVTFSAFFAACLLVTLISLPIHYTLRSMGSPMLIAVLTTSVNDTLCVVIGLVVWFQLDRGLLDDSYKYAIIGGLQLWMLLVTQCGILAAEVMNRRDRDGQSYLYNISSGSGMTSLHDKKSHDNVSVSDGDGTLNSAITMGYDE